MKPSVTNVAPVKLCALKCSVSTDSWFGIHALPCYPDFDSIQVKTDGNNQSASNQFCASEHICRLSWRNVFTCKKITTSDSCPVQISDWLSSDVTAHRPALHVQTWIRWSMWRQRCGDVPEPWESMCPRFLTAYRCNWVDEHEGWCQLFSLSLSLCLFLQPCMIKTKLF